MTIPQRYPVPHIFDFNNQIHGSTVFSKLDLERAYMQIPINPADRHKSAVITPWGLFEYTRLNFGMQGAASTWQAFIDRVFRGLDFVYVYLDDLLIYSTSPEQHCKHLQTVFERLEEFGLILNFNKCVFGKDRITFLGYEVDKDGIRPLQDKVQAIKDFPLPKTAKQLKRMIGLFSFYRRFIPNAANILIPLNQLLLGKYKPSKILDWTPEQLQAFQEVKDSLAKATLLAHPKPDCKLYLFTDASSNAAAGCLAQWIDPVQHGDKQSEPTDLCTEQNLKSSANPQLLRNFQPLAFYSTAFSKSQLAYSTYQRELLAIHLSVKHFRNIIEGRELIIVCDHRPLSFAFSKPNNNASPIQQRYLNYISEFSTEILYLPGSLNIAADALSRMNLDAITISSNIDYAKLAQEQTQDPELQEFLQPQCESSLTFKRIFNQESNTELWFDTSGETARLYCPPTFRKLVFQKYHSLTHAGIKATIKLLTARFIWKHMKKDITNWVRTCIDCQKTKVHRHTQSPLQHFPVPDEKISEIHIDIVGRLPLSNGYSYCLTIIDRFSRYIEAIPIVDMSAETCAKAILERWIAHFGLPRKIYSDQGRQFESNLFYTFNSLLGCRHFHTTAYHPQCNGLIERQHRQLKSALRACMSKDWASELPLILLGLRNVYREELKASTSQLVFGRSQRLPADLFMQTVKSIPSPDYVQKLTELMSKLRPTETSKHGNKRRVFIPQDLQTCSHVFLRTDGHKKPLQPCFEGPFAVVERKDKIFRITVKGKDTAVSIDRVKPAYLLNEDITVSADDLGTDDSTDICIPTSQLQQQIPSGATVTSQQQQSRHVQFAPVKTTRCGRVSKLPERYR